MIPGKQPEAGQASFHFQTHNKQTDVAWWYLSELWQGQHPASRSRAELRAVIRSWRLGAVVVEDTGQQPRLVTVLTGLLGTPTYHVGILLSWLLPPAPGPGNR